MQPEVILKWVNHLQALKKENKLPANFGSPAQMIFPPGAEGVGVSYSILKKLIHAVDYISMHTYPYHNTHYNPDFWQVPPKEAKLSAIEKVDAAMMRAKQFAVNQHAAVRAYMKSVGADKPIHIGETGWATVSDGFYGREGSRATDEYKQSQYYHHMRNWTNSAGISIFYFEAFDEQWKDAGNPVGSENHFGLFTLEGKAKYALWDLVDEGTFEDLSRGGNKIVKTYEGKKASLINEVKPPPSK